MKLKLRKILSTFLFFLALTLNLSASTPELTERYRISLLTYAKGTELYSIFGHSALRVIDDSLKIDFVYNYGTFSFSSSKFYSDFLKGKLLYRLSRSSTEYVVRQNQKKGREIIENILLLNSSDTRRLVQILERNYLPQNREYFYDFFYDNCSTRILSVIDSASGFKLNKSYINYSPISFRKHTNLYLKTTPWTRLGINCLMGITADKKASGKETSFLPDHLQAILLENPLFISANNHTLVSGKKSDARYNMSSIYVLLGICVLSIVISYREGKLGVQYKIADILLISPAIAIGTIIIFMWSYSNLVIYNYNLNLLWANPLLIFLLFKKDGISRMRLILTLGLICGAIYTTIFTNEWAIMLYIITVITRIYNPFVKLKKLSPDIIKL